MTNFTKEDLQTILSWGMDRREVIGKEEFEKEGSTKVYLKAEYYLLHRDELEEIRKRTLLHGGVNR